MVEIRLEDLLHNDPLSIVPGTLEHDACRTWTTVDLSLSDNFIYV